ncbi:MAG TPA: deoxyguanosinetriphosphate triphosphohydrolase, partial [Bryobacteraceae bacterium]|nr:deoxyguanosinetriphosphate triphosphohydrolase [Bryobacteraceae bacterium]
AFSARFFDMDDVAESVPEYAEIRAAVETQFPGAPARIRFNEALRRLIDLLVSGLIEGTLQAVQESGVKSVEDVRLHPVRLARFTPAAVATTAALKQFLRRRVYFTEALIEERRRSAAMIAGLFQFFLENPDRLPESYREESKGQPLHRVVCDYIAGMTDGYLRRMHDTFCSR